MVFTMFILCNLFHLVFLFSLFDISLAVEPDANNSTTPKCASLPLQVHTVFQFNETGTWIENIAARQNGDLIMTMAGPKAQVYLMEMPSASDFNKTARARTRLLHNFSEVNVLLGIAEPQPDVFVVAGGNLTEDRNPVPKSWAVFEMAFQNQTREVATRKVVDIPEAMFLNGAVALANSTSRTVLIGDSVLGGVFRVNTMNGTYEMAFQTPEMAPVKTADTPFGINGMKMRGDMLYFDNSDDRTFYKTKITNARSTANATVEKVATAAKNSIFVDDFDIAPDGTIWAAGSFGNTLLAVDPNSGHSFVAAGSKGEMTMAGATATIFGRGNEKDKSMLYVVTSGALGLPVNGSVTEPAKVLSVNTTAFAPCISPKILKSGSPDSVSLAKISFLTRGKTSGAITMGTLIVSFVVLGCIV